MTGKKGAPNKGAGRRRKAGEKVHPLEGIFRSLVETAGAGIVILDREGNITYGNDRLCLMSGYSKKNITGKPFAGFIHGDDLLHLTQTFLAAVSGIRRSEILEFRLVRKDGQCIWVNSNPEPIVVDGQVKGFSAIIYDITGRRLLEEALAKSEERYRTMLDHMQDTYHELDLEGRFTFVSESATHSFGYLPEELIGKSYRLAVPEEDVRHVFRAFNEVYRTGKPNKGLAHRILHKNGNITYSEASIDLNRDAQGRVVGFNVVNRDITGRRQMEEELTRLASVVRYSSELVNLATPDGRMLFLNEAGARMLGIDQQEVEKYNVIQVLPAHIREKALSEILPALAKGEMWEGDLQYVNLKTGLLTDVHAMTFAVKDPSTGVPLYIANVSLDITERKRAEDAQKESEEQLKASLENAPDGIYMNDLEGNFLYGNRRCEEIIGYRREELIGKNFLELSILSESSLARAADILKDNIDGKSTGPDELELIARDGRRIPVEINTSLVQRGGERVVLAFLRDIGERKRAEERLRESEEHFRRLSENALDVIYRYRLKPSPGFEYISPSSINISGYTPAEYYADPMLSARIIHPEDRARFERYFTSLDSLGTPLTLRWIHKDGHTIWYEEIDVPVYDADGQIVALEGIARDITDRKKAEEALWESEGKFKNIIEHVTDIFYVQNVDREILYISPQATNVLGYPTDKIQTGWQNYMTDSPINLVAEEKSRLAITTGEKQAAYSLEFMGRDGEKRLVEINESPLKNEKGAVIGIVGAARDITERHRIESALRESEEKYRLLVENALEAICIAADGMFIFVNHRTVELTGYSQEELTSRPFIEFVHPDDQQLAARRYLQRLKGVNIPDRFAFRAIFKSGDIRWIELSAVPITWEGRLATLSFMTDITDRRHLEEEQQRVAKLESVGLLAAGIAHDFNNILTAILGNISLASIEATPGSELLNSLEQAEKASLRAKDLTQQLLTFSRGGAPVRKLASLTDLIRDTAGFSLRGTNIKCHLHIPTDLWNAEIDAGQVSQVIHNLVINAQQAMPAGGAIDIKADNMAISEAQSLGRGLPLKAGNYVRVAVTDHGSGIDAQHLDKIFDPFFTTKQKGSGLGLATSFSIARNHGGHLSVESEMGTGSTFFLYLPASAETSSHEQDKKTAIKAAGKARILVMDDEQGVRDVAGRMLSNLGYGDIEFAADGAEAIRLYKAAIDSGHPFTVAILDLTISGGMGGQETVRGMLKIDPGAKAIVSSGYADDAVIARYRDYGFSGMVAKPYTLTELGKVLHEVIG